CLRRQSGPPWPVPRHIRLQHPNGPPPPGWVLPASARHCAYRKARRDRVLRSRRLLQHLASVPPGLVEEVPAVTHPVETSLFGLLLSMIASLNRSWSLVLGHGSGAQIPVPAVGLLIDAPLRHALVHPFEPLLALAAADNLADLRREHVHRRDRPAVVIHPHVERLDVLRVVHHDDRLLRVLFGEIALVLRL